MIIDFRGFVRRVVRVFVFGELCSGILGFVFCVLRVSELLRESWISVCGEAGGSFALGAGVFESWRFFVFGCAG